MTGLAAAVISGKTSPADAKTALGLVRGDLKSTRADLKTLRDASAPLSLAQRWTGPAS